MVVVVQPRRRQTLGLGFVKGAEGHAGFEAHRFDALYHLLQVGHIALVRVLPRRPHAEAGRPGVFSLAGRVQHLLHLHQALRL